MTETLQRPTPASDTPPPRPNTSKGWLGQLLLRLHFYAGILVGPFILIAALSGAAYAVTPQIEQVVYDRELHAPVTSSTLPLAEQIEAAEAYAGDDTLVAVRPAPESGDTTRVMFTGTGLGESETRSVFVDPGTAEIRGDLTTYGTSGALPIRTWVDHLHRNLHLGDTGRLYSELAASWLGVVVLAGAALWVLRYRKARRARRDMVRPNNKVTGYRRIFSWHASTGIWLLVGALFLSATGITWSTYGGANVDKLRAALDWGTPAVDPALTETAGPTATGDHAGHAGHGSAAPATDDAAAPVIEPTTFDEVLGVARSVNVNTGLVQITPPTTADTAWVVQEIQRSYPTEVDSVAINGDTLEVVDRTDFKDFNLAAKLTRWGIDTHMGQQFGIANQIVLVVTALGIATMVVFGYLMWWKRRPARPGALVGKPAAAGALARAPWWGTTAVIVIAAGIGWFLPLLGISLIGFVLVDAIVTATRTRSTRR